MTKNKNKKKDPRTFVPRPKEELEELLVDAIESIAYMCEGFDRGQRQLAPNLASVLRTLFHTNMESSSRSLFYQLGKSDVQIYDTLESLREGDKTTSFSPVGGLAIMEIVMIGKTPMEHWSPHNLGAEKPKIFTPFSSWWNNTLFEDNFGAKFSRRRIIMQIANEDGGAHISENISKEYYNLTRNNTYGYDVTMIDGPAFVDNKLQTDPNKLHVVNRNNSGKGLIQALIRQFAHEVMMTFPPSRSAYSLSVSHGHKVLLPGVIVSFHGCTPLE